MQNLNLLQIKSVSWFSEVNEDIIVLFWLINFSKTAFFSVLKIKKNLVLSLSWLFSLSNLYSWSRIYLYVFSKGVKSCKPLKAWIFLPINVRI